MVGIGSPPCVRGAGAGHDGQRDGLRFTPVRTGSSVRRTAAGRHRSVHPRAYGEQANGGWVHLQIDGSPPCVRGGGGRRERGVVDRRFTPVRTGKRRGGRDNPAASAVHPRAYGEETPTVVCGETCYGSPPCVRGRVQRPHADPIAYPRFTPVRNGKGADGRTESLHVPLFTPTRTRNSKEQFRARSLSSVHVHAFGDNKPQLPSVASPLPAGDRWKLCQLVNDLLHLSTGRAERRLMQGSPNNYRMAASDNSPMPKAFPRPMPLTTACRKSSASVHVRTPSNMAALNRLGADRPSGFIKRLVTG